MFVAVGRFELFIPASGSLKDKRAVVRSVTQTVAKKFNVSIAEVDHQDLWQRARVAVVTVNTDHGHLDST
ncbi:MAG: DUF503 domain-containing protein, partial [Actinomycetota bacterium]